MRKIRLTEGDLRRIVNRSVKRALRECGLQGPIPKDKEEKCWTVWVGGVEVNDYTLTRAEAERLARRYEADGYDDVVIDKAY